ncbi:hypothetical protein FA13DRAFT_1733561 [Coprinellus micaceus]|uniref:Zinc/iron permease n=1 Tax=Coprinellus micaceus TaxID=71717 RepID=A0A4Y7T9L0_COPMI|nr:hypothetical protein FA13DRAFT_1733561 [Coprinellus micaceus]
MFVQLAVLASVLGAASFAFGILPLAVTFSKSHIERLAAVGTGLLLGAGLGVIIPEGIENLIESSSHDPDANFEPPTHTIAVSLLVGFILMLALEQLAIPNSHSFQLDPSLPTPALYKSIPTEAQVEFDAELMDLERRAGSSSGHARSASGALNSLDLGPAQSSGRQKAFALTVGLVIHSLADGLALGVSSLAKTEVGSIASNISIVVFLALLLHKGPTALALTTSLLAFNLPRADCKKYLFAFTAATPISALLSYALFSFFTGDRSEDSGTNSWTGIAMLVSGGSFLYVATVLQPVSHSHGGGVQEMRPATRVVLVVLGMATPVTLASLLGHGH